MTAKKLLTIKEAAELLNVTEGSMKGLIRRGCVPYIKLSEKVLRIDEEELLECLEKRKVKPSKKR